MPDFAVRTAFTATDRVSPAFSRMEKAANATRSAMSALLPMFGVAVIANYANKAIELASSLTEVQNVVDTTFGKDSDTINKWSKNAINQFGLSELQAKQFTGSLGAMMKSSGLASGQIVKFSTDLVGLSGDFASFYNLPIEEAFEKIRSGISGETEPLKRLGINMSVANMEAFALTQGITKQWKVMSQAEQTQLRYSYLMKASKDAQGDFNKTLATSYANQKRVLGVQFDQALANLAKGILPSLTEGFKSLNQVFKNTDWEAVGKVVTRLLKLIPPLLKLFVAWKIYTWGVILAQKVMLGLGWLKYLFLMRDVIGSAVMRTQAWAVAQKAINFLLSANPIGLVITAIGVLAYAIYDLYTNWEKYQLNFQVSIQNFVTGFSRAKMEVYELLNAIGLISDKELTGAKLNFLENFTAGTKLKIDQIRANKSPNESGANLQAGNTNVNVYSNGTEAKAEVTPRRGAKVNMSKLGYQQ